MELYFAANDIKDEKKVPVLLSAVGGKTYALLRSLVTPTAPKDKSFKDISDALKEHFESKPIKVAERYYFRRRVQAPGESIAEFVAELHRLSTHCEFDGYLEDELCDQLVCGLRNKNIWKKLFLEANLTFQKALELAQSYKAAENAQQLKESANASVSVQMITSGSRSGSQQQTAKRDSHTCHRCGLTNLTSVGSRMPHAMDVVRAH